MRPTFASKQLPYGPGRDLLAAAEQALRENPRLQYHEALKQVGREQPDLAQRYRDQVLRPGTLAVSKPPYRSSERLSASSTEIESPQFITTLGRVMLSESRDGSRIPLAMIGTFYKGKQKFSITRADVEVIADNFAKRGTGNVVLDYEHASEFPEMAQGQPVPAAGWIVGVDRQPDADGIVWGTVELTTRARKLIAAGEYKYISPVIDWGVRDRRTGEPQGATLTSAALTNRPVLDQMPAISLADNDWSVTR